jgi:hypothetical protein
MMHYDGPRAGLVSRVTKFRENPAAAGLMSCVPLVPGQWPLRAPAPA